MTSTSLSLDASRDGPLPRDLRLVPVALACITSAWLALGTAPAIAFGACFAAAVGGVVMLRRPSVPRHGSVWAPALLVGACVGVCALLRIAALHAGPIRALAARHARGTAEFVVTGDPLAFDKPGRPPFTLIPARLELWSGPTGAVSLRAPVSVLADGNPEAWRSLLPSTHIAVSGGLRPAKPGTQEAAALSVRAAPRVVGEPSTLQRVAGSLRDGLRRAASGLLPDARGLLPGLVEGDTSGEPASLGDAFRATGLTHLTAVSGENLIFVIGAVMPAARFLGVRGRALTFTGLFTIVGFTVLARPQPSVLRAAAMALIALSAAVAGRQRAGISLLCGGTILLLMIDPWLSRSYGFALSASATAGLLILGRGWADRLVELGVPSRLAHSLAATAAAEVCCLPLIVALTGTVSLTALPANLLAEFAVGPATVLGALALAIASVSMVAAQAVAWLGQWPTEWIAVVARTLAAIPGSSITWPGGKGMAGALSVLTAFAAAAVMLVVLARISRRRAGHIDPDATRVREFVMMPDPPVPPGPPRGRGPRRPLVLLAVLVLLLGGWWWIFMTRPAGWPPKGWLMVACDVGQGDGLVLADGPGTAIVVDTGPDPARMNRCLTKLGVKRIPLVVLTHFHADHVDGLPGVLTGRTVKEIETTTLDDPAGGAAKVQTWASAAGVPVTRVRVDETRTYGPLSWHVLWPDGRPLGNGTPYGSDGPEDVGEGSGPNNASIVILVDAATSDGPVRILLTGDVEPPAQEAILLDHADVRAQVLKVPHHGSPHQDPDLVGRVGARIAVISVGRGNPYGHPSMRTVALAGSAGARVLRTDDDGSVAVVGPLSRLRVSGEHGTGAVGPETANEPQPSRGTGSHRWGRHKDGIPP